MDALTCNQLMVLMDFYRGTFLVSKHMGTVWEDTIRLVRLGLLWRHPECEDDDIRALRITTKGESHIQQCLLVLVERPNA